MGGSEKEEPAKISFPARFWIESRPDASLDIRRALLELFDARANERNVSDLLFLHECGFEGADWYYTRVVSASGRTQGRRAEHEQWSGERLQRYVAQVERLRRIAKHYAGSEPSSERERARIAACTVRKWDDAK